MLPSVGQPPTHRATQRQLFLLLAHSPSTRDPYLLFRQMGGRLVSHCRTKRSGSSSLTVDGQDSQTRLAVSRRRACRRDGARRCTLCQRSSKDLTASPTESCLRTPSQPGPPGPISCLLHLAQSRQNGTTRQRDVETPDGRLQSVISVG